MFAVTFRREDWPHLADDLPLTLYFGEDGWPLDFPKERKHLGEGVKAFVQTSVPLGWRWHLDCPEEWERAERDPEYAVGVTDHVMRCRIFACAIHGR